DMQEMDFQPVDLHVELRISVDPLLEAAPIVPVLPMVDQSARRSKLDALTLVANNLAVRPTNAIEPRLQIVDSVLRNLDFERGHRASPIEYRSGTATRAPAHRAERER